MTKVRLGLFGVFCIGLSLGWGPVSAVNGAAITSNSCPNNNYCIFLDSSYHGAVRGFQSTCGGAVADLTNKVYYNDTRTTYHSVSSIINRTECDVFLYVSYAAGTGNQKFNRVKTPPHTAFEDLRVQDDFYGSRLNDDDYKIGFEFPSVPFLNGDLVATQTAPA